MTRSCGWSAGLTVGLLIFMTNTAAAQLMSICVPDSPERRGEIGCSTIQSKTLPEGLRSRSSGTSIASTQRIGPAVPLVRRASRSTRPAPGG